MTPIDESESHDDHAGNYAGEAKTECLVLCSSLPSNHHQRLPPTQPHIIPKYSVSDPCPVLANNRLATLRNSERFNLPGINKKYGCTCKPALPNAISLTQPNTEFITQTTCQPRLVKVSVYTKAVNPYIVIYDSSKKYAKPSAYLKLVNCTVKAGGQEEKTTDDDNNNDDECLFSILPSKLEGVDSVGAILLRASSIEKRDEWVTFLTEVCQGKGTRADSTTGYIPGSSVLPTLVEQEDNDENDGEQSKPIDTLKSPSRRKHREGRRSSLNSLGIRLRGYKIGNSR